MTEESGDFATTLKPKLDGKMIPCATTATNKTKHQPQSAKRT